MADTQLSAAMAANSNGTGNRTRELGRRRPCHTAVAVAATQNRASQRSRVVYSNLVLEQVAADAGYTRGALYHQFDSKEDLVLAVVEWVEQTWWADMAPLIDERGSPADTLVRVARAHAVFCRRDIARVMMTLRIEFSRRDHPVGRAVDAAVDRLLSAATELISDGRDRGTIPDGPPARVVAGAYLGAIEGVVISVAGKEPFDEILAGRVAAGVLGLSTLDDADVTR